MNIYHTKLKTKTSFFVNFFVKKISSMKSPLSESPNSRLEQRLHEQSYKQASETELTSKEVLQELKDELTQVSTQMNLAIASFCCCEDSPAPLRPQRHALTTDSQDMTFLFQCTRKLRTVRLDRGAQLQTKECPHTLTATKNYTRTLDTSQRPSQS